MKNTPLKRYEQMWVAFSDEEKQVLLCFMPFQSNFYYNYDIFWDYLSLLSEYHHLDQNPEPFYNIVIKAIDVGFLVQAPSKLAFLEVSPMFSHFLNQYVKEQCPSHFLKTLNESFIRYYTQSAKELYGLLKSDLEEDQSTFKEILKYDHSNIYHAAFLSADLGEDVFFVYYILSTYFYEEGLFDQLLHFCQKLKTAIDRQIESFSDTQLYVLLIESIGTAYLKLERLGAAKKYFEEALTSCQENQHTFRKIDVKILKCALYSSLANCTDNVNLALDYHRKALSLAEQVDGYTQMGSLLFNLSEALFELHKHEESKHYLDKAILCYENTGDKKGLKAAQLSLARHLQHVKEFIDAEKEFQQALSDTKESQPIGKILQDLASLYYTTKQIDKAEQHCQLAIKDAIKHKNHQQEGNAYNLLSAVSFEKEVLEEAFEYAQKALLCYEKAENPTLMAQTYSNIALMCYNIGFYEDAMKVLEEGMVLYREIENPFGLAKSRALLAMSHLALGQQDLAQMECLKSLTYFIEVEHIPEIENSIKLAERIFEVSQDIHFKHKIKHLTNDY